MGINGEEDPLCWAAQPDAFNSAAMPRAVAALNHGNSSMRQGAKGSWARPQVARTCRASAHTLNQNQYGPGWPLVRKGRPPIPEVAVSPGAEGYGPRANVLSAESLVAHLVYATPRNGREGRMCMSPIRRWMSTLQMRRCESQTVFIFTYCRRPPKKTIRYAPLGPASASSLKRSALPSDERGDWT